MNKPVKPNITIPESFAKNGIKTDFDSDLITEGFDSLKPDVLAGDNLNKFIDDTYKGLNYGMAAADAINLINEGETLTVVDGKLTSGATGGGLEVCDIGMALYVDETKGLRRYLNGQIVDINTNTQAFLNRLKQITTLHPSLLCTEEEWQTAKTMYAFGQVGKFVFNYADDGVTVVSVRIPRVVNIQGVFDLQNLGLTVEAGLPDANWNIQTETFTGGGGSASVSNISKTSWKADKGSDQTYIKLASFALSKASPIYGNSDTVQQEAIQYPYFIQIATGQETENNITNEIELNNPSFFGDSKYVPTAVNNLSWLKSEGQSNPKGTYPSFYDWILENVNKGEKGFKLSTASDITDYDFVINTADETFRLPLKNHTADDSIEGLTLYFYVGETVQNANLIDAGRIGEILPTKTDMQQAAKASMPSDKYIDLTFGASGATYTAPANGYFYLFGRCVYDQSISNITTGQLYCTGVYGNPQTEQPHTYNIPVKKGDNIRINTTFPNFHEVIFRFIYAEGSK